MKDKILPSDDTSQLEHRILNIVISYIFFIFTNNTANRTLIHTSLRNPGTLQISLICGENNLKQGSNLFITNASFPGWTPGHFKRIKQKKTKKKQNEEFPLMNT